MDRVFRTFNGVEYIRRDEYNRLLEEKNKLESIGDRYFLMKTTIYDTRGEDPDTGGQTVLTYTYKFIMKVEPSFDGDGDKGYWTLKPNGRGTCNTFVKAYMDSLPEDETVPYELRDGWNGMGWYIDWDRYIDIEIGSELDKDTYDFMKPYLNVGVLL
tara:strand:- start:959 stop:1429 length:471 start_codon:yes stop_codon:yes gene_type:complete